MSTTTQPVATLTVPLEQIHVPENVRQLDGGHVDALAGSIRLQGLIVPLVVRTNGEGYELVAGFHRIAAARQLGLAEVPVVVRDGDSEDADRAVENITRLQLNPYEEAKAVHAMLERGLSEDGAAQALGWARQRVTARVKLLALPERAQQMIGTGQLPLAALDTLITIGETSRPTLEAVVAYLDSEHGAGEGGRLVSSPTWVIARALHESKPRVFAAYLGSVNAHDIEGLRLGKKAEAELAEAEKLHRKVDSYAYGPPSIRFSEAHVDQARAAGALLEFPADTSAPLIVDARDLYRELARDAITKTVEQLRAKAEQHAATAKQSRRSDTPENAETVARRERDAQLRELADQAHGINHDLGVKLVNELATVDPSDITVARFFVYALLDSHAYGGGDEHAQRIAQGGVRLVVGDLRHDVTKTRKDGSRGRLRIDYDSGDPIKWLWRFIDGATTASELYGRALVVIAAEQYASRIVLPASKRPQTTQWHSHGDKAAKALAKLAGPHLPGSLAKLEQAVKRAERTYHATAWPKAPATAQDDEGLDADLADDDAAVEVDGLEEDTNLDVDEDGELQEQ
jgi:ParB/RepB/Spo0J family partition protein